MYVLSCQSIDAAAERHFSQFMTYVPLKVQHLLITSGRSQPLFERDLVKCGASWSKYRAPSQGTR